MLIIWCAGSVLRAAEPSPGWFEIHCVDAATGRDVPLVEVETVNHLRYVSDNRGRIAFAEPGFEGRETFFHVRSHGYSYPKDGFGYAGVRLTPRAGRQAEIKLTRVNLAERLYRITGAGRLRDSFLLGQVDAAANETRGGVLGQDSIQAARYRDRLYWFWGDTDRQSYPLGHFRTAGATSALPGAGGLRPGEGIGLEYFVGKEGFSRPMMPLPERPEGVIWIDGLVVVPDAAGRERLVCHYSRRKGLEQQLEHGLAVFNDEKVRFEPARQLPDTEAWRLLQGHPVIVTLDGQRWVYAGLPLLHVRVPATYEAVLDPARYEAFSCRDPDASGEARPRRNAAGQLEWTWQTRVGPVGPAEESAWLKAGRIQPDEARFSPRSADGRERPLLHGGTVRWNPFRQAWVMIALEVGGRASHLGEVWYAEGPTPVGPFPRAVRVVTHDRQSFYNPCHHDFLDEEAGQFIYFEGTYVNTFSGNPDLTPRYNYNQIMYRLDLADARLRQELDGNAVQGAGRATRKE